MCVCVWNNFSRVGKYASLPWFLPTQPRLCRASTDVSQLSFFSAQVSKLGSFPRWALIFDDRWFSTRECARRHRWHDACFFQSNVLEHLRFMLFCHEWQNQWLLLWSAPSAHTKVAPSDNPAFAFVSGLMPSCHKRKCNLSSKDCNFMWAHAFLTTRKNVFIAFRFIGVLCCDAVAMPLLSIMTLPWRSNEESHSSPRLCQAVQLDVFHTRTAQRR